MAPMLSPTLAPKAGTAELPRHSPVKGREAKSAFGSSRQLSISRGRCKLFCSIHFLLELRVIPLLSRLFPNPPRVSSWVYDRPRTDAGTEFLCKGTARTGNAMGPRRGQDTVPLSEAASAAAVEAARWFPSAVQIEGWTPSSQKG